MKDRDCVNGIVPVADESRRFLWQPVATQQRRFEESRQKLRECSTTHRFANTSNQRRQFCRAHNHSEEASGRGCEDDSTHSESAPRPGGFGAATDISTLTPTAIVRPRNAAACRDGPIRTNRPIRSSVMFSGLPRVDACWSVVRCVLRPGRIGSCWAIGGNRADRCADFGRGVASQFDSGVRPRVRHRRNAWRLSPKPTRAAPGAWAIGTTAVGACHRLRHHRRRSRLSHGCPIANTELQCW